MEWENKFSSIVKETESNLAKVKQRLNTSKNMTFSNNSFGPSSSSFPMSSSTPYSTTASLPFTGMPGKQSSVWMRQGGFSTGAPSPDTTNLVPNIDHSPAVSLVLSDRIEAQAQTISNLSSTIKLLENERDHVNKKLRDVSDEVSTMGSRVAERGVHLPTERKVEQWKQEVMSELVMLRNQVRSSQDGQAREDIYQMKRLMKEEFDALRRDMDYLKTRVDKVEANVDRTERSQRDTSHRHDRLEAGLNELGTLQRSTNQSLVNRSVDQSSVGTIRDSVQFLADKLNILETKVQAPPPKPQSPTKLRKKPKKRSSSELLSPHLSDLDLSDDLTDLDLDDDMEALESVYNADNLYSDVDLPTDRYKAKKYKAEKEDDYEFSDPGVTSLGLLSDLQSGELAAGYLSGDTLDHTLSIDEL